MNGEETLFLRVGLDSDDFSRCFSFAIHPPDWLPGWVGCSNTIPISPLWGLHTLVFTLNQQLFIMPCTCQNLFNKIDSKSGTLVKILIRF